MDDKAFQYAATFAIKDDKGEYRSTRAAEKGERWFIFPASATEVWVYQGGELLLEEYKAGAGPKGIDEHGQGGQRGVAAQAGAQGGGGPTAGLVQETGAGQVAAEPTWSFAELPLQPGDSVTGWGDLRRVRPAGNPRIDTPPRTCKPGRR